ncbi:MAG: DUF1573 domain-containing protein [Saprospiraceae bacterium]|nr:DUF1573 domain-containing protein [Saprospiraceae bacterium]MDW8483086.1 DUF1573 domain-containing protein [Saprospiraceae bacterium]
MLRSTLFVLSATFLTAFGLRAQSASSLEIGDPTLNAGKVKWIPMQIETGDVLQGIPVERTIEVRNISDENLILLEVLSGCHCTVAEWTKEPIPPGNSGYIRVVFDAKEEGEFYKVISIRTNFDPETFLALGMVGRVVRRKPR